MSSIVTSFLNATIGFLVNKARRDTAERLRDGDLNDEQCRQFIIRELDDIKSKIDGLARMYLLASIDFLEQGMRSFTLAREEPSEGQTAMVARRQPDDGPINQACALLLSEEIKRLKITSNERYATALESFKDSEREATRAFNNEALSVADRILATRLRMVSMIFRSIQDPDAAIDRCRLYLEKLHKLPAIQKMFAVHLSGGLKARLNKSERTENVISVTMINHVLCDFEKKFGQTGSNLERLFNWPRIQVGKESYNPLATDEKIVSEIVRSSETSPAVNTSAGPFETSTIKCWPFVSAVTSDRKILSTKDMYGDDVFLFDVSGDSERVFWSLPEKGKKKNKNDVEILAILTDEKDNVFVAYRSRISGTNVYKLVCLDINGNVRRECTLEFLVYDGRKFGRDYAVTKDGKVVIIIFDVKVYVYDINSGELKNTLCRPRDENFWPYHITVTDTNQIIVAEYKAEYFIQVWSMEGDLVRKIKFPDVINYIVETLAFNYVTKDILVMTRNPSNTLLKFSQNSERPETTDMTWFKGGELRSHPSGPVALIGWGRRLLFLQ